MIYCRVTAVYMTVCMLLISILQKSPHNWASQVKVPESDSTQTHISQKTVLLCMTEQHRNIAQTLSSWNNGEIVTVLPTLCQRSVTANQIGAIGSSWGVIRTMRGSWAKSLQEDLGPVMWCSGFSRDRDDTFLFLVCLTFSRLVRISHPGAAPT